MRKITFDTETTGLKPGSICQLSYIICEDGVTSGVNMYFKVGYIDPGAQRVHGLSVEMLESLSGGAVFGAHTDKISRDFLSCGLWIAHNFTFDFSFLSAEFGRCGMRIAAADSFCTMKRSAPVLRIPPKWQGSAYKYPNLAELISFFGISGDKIRSCAGEIFNIQVSDLQRHDARFDCAATHLCYLKGAERGHWEL